MNEVPDFDDVVRAGAGQRTFVAVPTDPQHVVCVTFELLHDRAGGKFDDLEELVRGARRQEFSVR